MSLKNLDLEVGGELHPIARVAKYFGCTAETLRDMCIAGEITHTRRDGRYLIAEKTIREWRDKHKVRAA